jgi:peptidoglycan-associated lipoprotein
MKLDSLKYGLALVLATTLLVGCETTSTADEEPVEPVAEGSANGAGETSSAPGEDQLTEQQMAEQKAQEAAQKEQSAMREVRTFYFDLDQSTIKSESRAPLAAHAAFLAANPNSMIVLEGHCDERGTKEYNIALGERRAKSIAQFLKVNGASDAQIEVVSYGEEQPAVMGSNEQSWSQNRRVFVEYK